MQTGLVTIASGRHQHLARQYDGVAAAVTPPDMHIIVAMGDPSIAAIPGRQLAARVLEMPAGPRGLPLAAARNAGAAAALDAGAQLLIFLDVDCIPGPDLIPHYIAAAAHPEHGGQLLSGPVHYLTPAPPGGYDLSTLSDCSDPHPARPAPAAGAIVSADHRLFWSLSFAVTAPVWARVGGFCLDYTGYGGEDTDFAETAHAAGVGLRWVGGATAYHQHHPVSRPPVEHLDDIVRNAAVFHRRWGWWPMRGWLDQFAAQGLVRYDEGGEGWLRCA